MNKLEFLNQFQLNSTFSIHQEVFERVHHVTQSAVLIPLVEVNNQLFVILTKRATHLKHHAGQVSFPGGKVEESDKTVIETALREAEEEIGLMRQHVEVIGQLPLYQTLTGFDIQPIIGILTHNTTFTADENEVAEIFKVPLKHFFDSTNHVTLSIKRQSKDLNVYFMPYRQYNIWGATAAILKDLCRQLGH